MRAIDADKLKEVLEKNFGHTGGASVLAQLIDAQDAIQPEPHWIPVTERLPETDGDYLITDDSGGVKTIEVDSFFILDDGKKMWCYSQNPVAWMELPEAYKGVTE